MPENLDGLCAKNSTASILHRRLLEKADIHLVLTAEDGVKPSPLSRFEYKMAALCVSAAGIIARFDKAIDHDTVSRSFPMVAEELNRKINIE